MTTNTREKLISAAITLFAEKGYRSTTIQEIAKEAGTNVAAINYHFQSKANFFAEVIMAGMESAKIGLLDVEPDRENAADILREFINIQIKDIHENSSRALIAKIRAQEMAEPGPVLDIVHKRLVIPLVSQIERIVAALLPLDSDPAVVRRHTLTVVANLQFYAMEESLRAKLYPEMIMDDAEQRQTAEHIYRTLMAGLAAERTLAKSGEKDVA